jgi:hypothetical protein
MKIKAINLIHQTKVNVAVNWLEKYNHFNDLRNFADDNDQGYKVKQYDKECQKAFDKYLDIVTELPKRERTQIEKSIYY